MNWYVDEPMSEAHGRYFIWRDFECEHVVTPGGGQPSLPATSGRTHTRVPGSTPSASAWGFTAATSAAVRPKRRAMEAIVSPAAASSSKPVLILCPATVSDVSYTVHTSQVTSSHPSNWFEFQSHRPMYKGLEACACVAVSYGLETGSMVPWCSLIVKF